VGYESIWAPWRLGYILSDKRSRPDESLELLDDADPECFLCQEAAEGDDRRRLVVERTDRTFTVLNLYPYNNGHLLVAPRRHLARLDELDRETQVELAAAITRMVGLLEKVLRPDGFNIGLNLGLAAGAGVPGHLHWHIVPRWSGDTNFMPSVAGANVIPQSLESLWRALTEALQ